MRGYAGQHIPEVTANFIENKSSEVHKWHDLHKWCRMMSATHKIKGGIAKRRLLSGVVAVVFALSVAALNT